MPNLHWLDRAHSLRQSAHIPCRILRTDQHLSVGDKDSGSLLIQGDNLYEGNKVFKHHYYPLIGKMNAEEAECAWALDRLHPKVKHWVRNLERQLPHSFSLPTSSDWFYPDFVAQLDDGRILVVEYKGGHLKDSADTREKQMVGKAWAKLSGNLFLMACKTDQAGRNVAAQFRHLLG